MQSDVEESRYEPVSDAYEGKSIFVTGSTGFLGKVFVEKIIHRCPKLEKVYVLLRETDTESAEHKLKKMLDCPIFKNIKAERPLDLKKIIPIAGDISKPKLGLKSEDETVLVENVKMVFHLAATIKFNEPLKEAINVNVEGTRRILELCRRMKKIQLFLHVSTAFCNLKFKVLDEVIYPPVIPLSDVEEIKKQEIFTSEELNLILRGFPNTYAFTKNIAENLVVKFHETERIPTVIVRPSIIVSCKDGPVGGWVDNWNGPTFLVFMISKGVVRVLHASSENVIDFIPVDYVANLIAVAAARCRSAKDIAVYNSCSSDANPLTLKKLRHMVLDDSIKNKSYKFPLPGLIFVQWKWLLLMLIFLLETVPVYVAHCYQMIFGKTQSDLKMLLKVDVVRTVLSPYLLRTWTMRSRNTSALFENLSPNDRRLFPCDVTTVNWNEYIPKYLEGIRKYLLAPKQK